MSFNKLPASASAWQAIATKSRIHNDTIHNGRVWKSASKIGKRQFLVLRAIWPQPRPLINLIGDGKILSNDNFQKAKNFLREQHNWQVYLDSMTQGVDALFQNGFQGLGTFTLVLKNQLVVRQVDSRSEFFTSKIDCSPMVGRLRSRNQSKTQGSPTEMTKRFKKQHIDTASNSSSSDLDTEEEDEFTAHTPQSGELADSRAIDEQVVNAALYLFLDAVTIHFEGLNVEWSLHRRPFALKNRNGEGGFKALVDGVLKMRHPYGDYILAILEVKPFTRDSKAGTAARMQETAEMTAWINNYPPPNLAEEREKTPKTM